jgi:hypothetical protein
MFNKTKKRSAMKKIALIVLLGTSCAYGMTQKLTHAARSPITCQVASSITGYFLRDVMKSIVSNDTLRGGIAGVGLFGVVFLHKYYFQKALATYEQKIKSTSSTDSDELPLVPAAVTFACNTAAWSAIWSSPDLVKSSLNYLDKAKLGNVAKVAAPAALVGCAALLLD